MAKYKHYDYSQSVSIPISLEEQIMPGTLEFAIHTLVEQRIDTSIFDDRYNKPMGLQPQNSVEGGPICIFERTHIIKGYRRGVQRECAVYGLSLWTTT